MPPKMQDSSHTHTHTDDHNKMFQSCNLVVTVSEGLVEIVMLALRGTFTTITYLLHRATRV